MSIIPSSSFQGNELRSSIVSNVGKMGFEATFYTAGALVSGSVTAATGALFGTSYFCGSNLANYVLKKGFNTALLDNSSLRFVPLLSALPKGSLR